MRHIDLVVYPTSDKQQAIDAKKEALQLLTENNALLIRVDELNAELVRKDALINSLHIRIAALEAGSQPARPLAPVLQQEGQCYRGEGCWSQTLIAASGCYEGDPIDPHDHEV